MKNTKLMPAFFMQASSRRTPMLFALLTGLAIGTALGILYASEKGKRLRGKVPDLIGTTEQGMTEEHEHTEHSHHAHGGHKRPKSDIKSLIHQGHTEEVHTEQGLSN